MPACATPVRVVIVDDMPLYRAALRYALKSYPQVEIIGEAADGLEAIAAARDCCPDVMLMDVSMPNMNGIDATRAITSALPETRVIMLTMHADGIEAKAVEAGACACLGKETRVVDLVGKIQTCNRIGEA